MRSGRIGKVLAVEVGVGEPPLPCYLPPEPTPDYLDWDRWLGPAPWRPYHHLIHPGLWRVWFDYSGFHMTDFGAHHFDIAQWGLGMDHTGPVEVIPPNGKDYKHLTYKYDNGVEMRHILYGPCVTFIGTEGAISLTGVTGESRFEPEEIGRECTYRVVDMKDIYGNKGHYDDFLDCVRTRRRPVADAAIGCSSIIVCHIGNIAYRLNRPLKWDPDKEEFIDDPQANRHLDRAKRQPWAI